MPIFSGGGGGGSFNGGTVTSALAVNPADPLADPILGVQAPAGAEQNGTYLLKLNSDIAASLWVDTDATLLLANTSLGGFANAQLVDTVGTLNLSSGRSANPLRLHIGTDDVFRVLAGGAVVIAQHAAPADGDLVAGECALWFDQTNGASKLMVKAKQADGTVKTAAIALS